MQLILGPILRNLWEISSWLQYLVMTERSHNLWDIRLSLRNHPWVVQVSPPCHQWSLDLVYLGTWWTATRPSLNLPIRFPFGHIWRRWSVGTQTQFNGKIAWSLRHNYIILDWLREAFTFHPSHLRCFDWSIQINESDNLWNFVGRTSNEIELFSPLAGTFEYLPSSCNYSYFHTP